ncbi:LacI family DNA-binding transcriptional regulator [Pontiellaceae bacterium B12219]|nr:LacI family DNA-binding transcriptional regulator [Pontiellaceae bacterium B12219]
MTGENSESSQKRVTIRDIARCVGVSHATVSLALKKNPRISKKTTQLVLEKAEELGYVRDPMLSALCNYRTKIKNQPTQAALAWINDWENPKDLRKINEFNLYWEGANEAARRVGYRLEEFATAELPLRRIDSILKARTIQGIIIPPVQHLPDGLDPFPWGDYATVCLGYSLPRAKAHFVCSAQASNAMRAFERAHQLGYKRIGFVSEFVRTRHFGVGFLWAQQELPASRQLPLLALNPADDFEQQQAVFERWLLRNRPDAILTDNGETLYMLKNLGIRVPEDIGLATTSIHDTPIDAGIDQNPFEIGRAAARTLIGLLSEQSIGIPVSQSEVHINGIWVDGGMLPSRK